MGDKYTREMVVASFLSRVDIKRENECWLWKGCTYNCGYGSFKWRDKMRGANRVMWEIVHGREVPEGMDVLHSCDVRLCVNPAHLWLGTHQDNMIDMHKKRRQPRVALTPEQVREIRALLPTWKKGLWAELANKYGVSKATISAVKRGRSYRHVE